METTIQSSHTQDTSRSNKFGLFLHTIYCTTQKCVRFKLTLNTNETFTYSGWKLVDSAIVSSQVPQYSIQIRVTSYITTMTLHIQQAEWVFLHGQIWLTVSLYIYAFPLLTFLSNNSIRRQIYYLSPDGMKLAPSIRRHTYQ